MYLYNISIIVEEDHHTTLIQWVKEEWLKGSDKKFNFLKMINSPHEGHTYSVQFLMESTDTIAEFQENKLLELQHYIGSNHYEKAFIFDSVLQYLAV